MTRNILSAVGHKLNAKAQLNITEHPRAISPIELNPTLATNNESSNIIDRLLNGLFKSSCYSVITSCTPTQPSNDFSPEKSFKE